MPIWATTRSICRLENVQVTVRDATVADVYRMTQIYMGSWNVSAEGVVSPEVAMSRTFDRRARYLHDRIQSGGILHPIVAVANGDIVGPWGNIAGAMHNQIVGIACPTAGENSESAEVDHVYVDPTCIGYGVGSVLMAAILEQMRAAGVKDANLWAFEGNQRARRFYEGSGWTPTGAKKDMPLLETDATVLAVEYGRSL